MHTILYCYSLSLGIHPRQHNSQYIASKATIGASGLEVLAPLGVAGLDDGVAVVAETVDIKPVTDFCGVKTAVSLYGSGIGILLVVLRMGGGVKCLDITPSITDRKISK